MAFNFPDTAGLDNGHTVENEQRGVFYSWDGNRGKWVVSGTTREGGGATTTSELLLANPTRLGGARTLPPVPDGLTTQEDYNKWLYDTLEKVDLWVGDDPPADPLIGQLWYCTKGEELTLYIYVDEVSEWAAAAPPVSLEGIEASIANVDAELMKVNANIAMNKRDIDEAVLDVREDQERQDQQIKVLQGELEQLAPSFEFGAWQYDDGDGIPQGTEYVLSGLQTQESFDEAKLPLTEQLNQCLADAGGDSSIRSQCNRDYDKAVGELPKVGETIKSNRWELANKVRFNYMDLDGTGHMFDNVEKGQLLDMVCEDGSGFMVAEITGVTLGMWYEDKILDIKPLQFKGVAYGRTNVKIFSIDNEIDSSELANFVRKTGDTMTGKLTIEKPIWIKPQDSPTGGWGNHSMLIVNQQDAATDSIIRIKQNGKDKLKVQYDGNTSLENNKLVKVADPEAETEGANKRYVDQRTAVTVWKYVDSDNPAEGEFSWETTNRGVKLKIANKTKDSIMWVQGKGRETDCSFDNSFFVSICDSTGKPYLIGECSSCDFSYKNKPKSHIFLERTNWEHDLVLGKSYCIRIPGLLPLITF